MTTFFFSAHGRLNRAQFWLGQFGLAACFTVAIVATLILVGGPQAIDGGKNLALIVVCSVLALVIVIATSAVTVWSSLCLGIKRFHDRDKPGVWVLIQFAPLVGPIWYFIEAFCLPGTYGANQFGPDPLHPEVGSVSAAREAARVAAGGPTSAYRPGWAIPLLLVPAAFGVLLVLAGALVAGHTRSWLAAATTVEGKVVALEPAGRSSDTGHETFRAVVEAKTSDGAPIHVTDIWATYPAPEVGSDQALAYPTGRPKEAVVVTFLNLWFLPAMLAGFGGAIALFWFVLALVVKLSWKRQPLATDGPRPVV